MSKPPADLPGESTPPMPATLPEDEQRQGEQTSTSTGSQSSTTDQTAPDPGSTPPTSSKLPAEMSAAELVVETAMVLGQIKALFPDASQPPAVERAKLLLIEMGARAALQWAVLAGNHPEISLPKSVDQMAAAGDKGLANFKIEQAQAPTRARRQDIRKT